MRIFSGKRISACLVLALVFAAIVTTDRAEAQSVQSIVDADTGKPIAWPSYVTIFDNAMYFRARLAGPGNDTQLWRSNGYTAERVSEIAAFTDPSYLSVYNGALYFGASQPGGGSTLWQYSPTGGVAQAPGFDPHAQNFEESISYGGNLYYRATRFSSTNIGTELWKFNGTTHTAIDMFPGAGSSYPQHFITYNSSLYFNACGQAGQGTELWRITGNGAPTNAATIYPNNGSSPENFAVYNNKLYFSAYDGIHGRELWSYDSATSQAQLAADILAGASYESSNPNNLCVYKDKLYFSATDGVHGYELWAYDGSVAKMVAEINPTPDPLDGDSFMMDSSPSELTVFNNKLYFSADDGSHGRELWSFNGTTAELEADINPGQYGSSVSELTVFGDRLYFSADSDFKRLTSEASPRAMFISATPVPEPSTWILLAMGGFGLLAYRRRLAR